MIAAVYAGAEDLDRALGDADDPVNPFGFAAAAARDSSPGFPEQFRAIAADRAGLHLSFVPAAAGGTGRWFDDTMMRVRVAAATCVLLTGADEQIERVVALLREGGAVAFALSEPDHGADVLAGECRLERTAEGLLLDGEKWMVGLGTPCATAYVVARSVVRGPAAFTGVLLNADDLAAGRHRPRCDRRRRGSRRRAAGCARSPRRPTRRSFAANRPHPNRSVHPVRRWRPRGCEHKPRRSVTEYGGR